MTVLTALNHSTNHHANGQAAARPELKPPAPSRRMTFGRWMRRGAGMGFLGFSAWLVAPLLWNVTSTQAVINAPVMTLRSTIEGVVKVRTGTMGDVLNAGELILDVENPLLDQSSLERLRSEATIQAERAAALEVQRSELDTLERQLAKDARRYQEASVRRLIRELEQAQAAASAAEELSKQKTFEMNLNDSLISSQSVSKLDTVAARHAAESARHAAAQTRLAALRLKDQLDDLRTGVYVSEGDGRADVPYSQQRLHEVAIKRAEISAQWREATVRAAQTRLQVEREEIRLRTRSQFTLAAPADGVIWRRQVITGSAVQPDSCLVQYIDRSQVFVDALVNERYLADIKPGQKVGIRLVGTQREIPGLIKGVLGRTPTWDDKLLAAEPPLADRRDVHIAIVFEDGAQSASFLDYSLGRPVEVVFGKRLGILRRILEDLLP